MNSNAFRLRIQIWSTSYYHVICNLFQFVCTWKFNGIYRAFQLLFRLIHGYSVTTNLWKLPWTRSHLFCTMFWNQPIWKPADLSNIRKRTYSERTFYANITRIKDTWYTQNPCENILLLPLFSHFIMFPCKFKTILAKKPRSHPAYFLIDQRPFGSWRA